MESNYIHEALKALDLLEAKEDQKKFIDKFGADVFDLFNKAKQRLKNNNISTDILWHVKHTEADKMKDIILSVYDDEKDAQKKRIIRGEDKQIRGEYKDLGIHGGYHVYEPLDYLSSMDLGVNTGWCTTGRYMHAHHPEFTPSEANAKAHFNAYYRDGKNRVIYFLDPETMYGKYAAVVYPRMFDVFQAEVDGKRLAKSNTTVYNDMDNRDYNALFTLPFDEIGVNIEYEFADDKEN